MKQNTTTLQVYKYLVENRNATLQEIADALKISSRANVLYHIEKLRKIGWIAPAVGKHRMFLITEDKQNERDRESEISFSRGH